MLFHALSPFAMTALFSPMLDRPHTNEEAQSRGGFTAGRKSVFNFNWKKFKRLRKGCYK